MPVCKKTMSLLAAFLFSLSAGAQSFPQISSPKMPSVASPAMGGRYYVPGTDSNYSPVKKEDESFQSADTSSDGTYSNDETAKRILRTVTAGELSSMNNLGLLDILGASSARSQNLLSGGSGNSRDTQKMLEKVLDGIEEIKQSTPEVVVPPAYPVVHFDRETAEERNRRPSQILRFSVNGYDILRTCSTVFISEVQRDGTFLITGDRRYTTDGKIRQETFHILFKSSPDEKTSANYTLAASVTQDRPNEYSFLYQLANRRGINAYRTGNFVSMRTDDPDWKLEFLVDLGENLN